MTNISTINPAIPIPGTALDAIQMQGNFAAAYSDINHIYSLFGQVPLQNVKTITSGSSYTVGATDQNLIINKTIGSATLILYTPGQIGRTFSVFDGKGDCATNNITIMLTSGTINNQSTFVMNINTQSQEFLDDGTNLWVKG